MDIKYYDVPNGCMGWIGDRYMLFASYTDYVEWIKERRTDENK